MFVNSFQLLFTCGIQKNEWKIVDLKRMNEQLNRIKRDQIKYERIRTVRFHKAENIFFLKIFGVSFV